MQQPIRKVEQWLILTLARRVRVFSVTQVANAWFDGDKRSASRAVARLEKQGLVTTYTELVSGRLKIEEPLLVWEPGFGKAPNFSKLAYRGRKRWIDNPKRELLLFATTKAVNRYAGYMAGKAPATNSLRHDLQLSELYLHFLKNDPKRCRRWMSEEEWKEFGYGSRKTAEPDAIIRENKRNHRLNVLEICGQYSPDRLREFHRQFQGYRYEIW